MTGVNNSKYRALLIEPDRYLARIYAKVLKRNGVDAFSVSTAQKAISEIDKINPDIIVLELQLPFNNGIEFLYELRSHADLQDTKVIVWSYISDIELKLTPKQASILSISKHLYKPNTSVNKLVDVILENLQK